MDGITKLIKSQIETWIWTYRREKSIKSLLCTYCMPGTSGVVSYISSTLIHTTKLRSCQRRKLKLRKLNRLLKTHRPQGQSLKPRSGWLNSPSDTSWRFLLSGHTTFLRSSVLMLGSRRIRFDCCCQSKRKQNGWFLYPFFSVTEGWWERRNVKDILAT